MKKWASTLTVVGAGLGVGNEALPTEPPASGLAPTKKIVQEAKLPAINKLPDTPNPKDTNLDAFRRSFDKQNAKDKAELFASLNAKQQALLFGKLSQEDKTLLARAEKTDWMHTNNRVWPSYLQFPETNTGYMSDLVNFAFDPISGKAIGLKKFTELLAPNINQVTVRSTRENSYASGFVMTTDIELGISAEEVPEIKGLPSHRVDLSVDAAGGKMRIASDPKGFHITFPTAGADPKGNIELTASTPHKIYETVTHKDFKIPTSLIPIQDDATPRQVKAISLPQGSLSVFLHTAPGVEIDLCDLKATKFDPADISGTSNAIYRVGKETRHVNVHINDLAHSIKPFQQEAIMEVSPEIAKRLKVAYVNIKNENFSPEENDFVDFAERHTVILSDATQGIEFHCGGGYHAPDPELQNAGIKIDGINSTVRVRSGQYYIDVPIMRDTDFAQKTEGQLEESLQAAAALLLARIKGEEARR